MNQRQKARRLIEQGRAADPGPGFLAFDSARLTEGSGPTKPRDGSDPDPSVSLTSSSPPTKRRRKPPANAKNPAVQRGEGAHLETPGIEEPEGPARGARPKRVSAEVRRYRAWLAYGPPRYVVGVDLGTDGGAVVIDCHDPSLPLIAVRTWHGSGTERTRLGRVRDELTALFGSVPPGRVAVGYERVYRHVSGDAAHSYGAHRAFLVLASDPHPLVPVSPGQAKRIATGRGGAEKVDVAAVARARAPGVAWTEHSADALAVALAVVAGAGQE